MSSFDIASVVAKYLKEYVQGPDYSKLIAEIREHSYVYSKLQDIDRSPKGVPRRILFINQDSVIVQDIEMRFDSTRFDTYKIMFKDWDTTFIKWADEESKYWQDRCWVDGCRMYGAQV